MEMSDLRLALYALVAVGVLLLLLRFGKIVARYAIILGALAVVGVFGLALLEHSRATRQAVQAATVASAGAAGASVVALILAMLLLAAVGGAGYFYLRWRLVERSGLRPAPRWLSGPNVRWRLPVRVRTQTGRQARPPAQPAIYVLDGEDDEDDENRTLDTVEILKGIDLEKWGF
jgi:hypothetical protein